MALGQHLQRKYEELQEQYNLLSEEIEFLRGEERTDDLSPRKLFKLKKQIEEAEEEREKVRQQLDALERPLGNEQFYQILWRLGYREQVRSFLKLIQSGSVGSFLIHGAPDYGQRWLLNRLVEQYVPYYLAGKVVTVKVSRRVRRSDIDALWRELACRVGLRGGQYSPSEITDRVYKLWQTQNVLLVFHEVHCMPQEAFQELIDNFWLPLVNQAKQSQSQTSNYKLFMFLLDYDGCVGCWDAPFAEKLDVTKPYTLIKSPRIVEFSKNDLATWIEDQFDKLPGELTLKEIDDTVQAILANSDNGIPELALQEICYRCGWNW